MQRDLVLGPALHRRPVRLQRDEVVADGGNLLDQVFAGRIVPAVNGVGMVVDRSTVLRMLIDIGIDSPRVSLLMRPPRVKGSTRSTTSVGQTCVDTRG